MEQQSSHSREADEGTTSMNKQYTAIIYFNCDETTDVRKALEVAVERLETFAEDIKIEDSRVEDGTY